MTRTDSTQQTFQPPGVSFPGDGLILGALAKFPERAAPLATPPAGSGLKPVMGDPGLPFLGGIVRMMVDGVEGNMGQATRFGPVTWTRLIGKPVVIVTGAEASNVVLTNRDKVFSQEGWKFPQGPFWTRSLILLDGAEHLVHRRIMQEAFARPRLEGYLDTMTRIIDQRVPEWGDGGEQVLFFPAIKRLSLDIATEVFMGAEPDEETERMSEHFQDCLAAAMAFVRFPVPGGKWYAAVRGRKELERYFGRRVKHKRGSDDTDLFAALCNVETAEGETFGKEDIVNHMIFLMMAAHDTSSAAATAVAYFLAKNPEWQDRCRAESLALGTGPIDLGGTEKLESLDLVFQEALRLVTPIPAVLRMATEDTEILGHYIPKGTHLAVGAGVTHRLAEYFRDPTTFDPERFAEPRREDKANRGANLAFGGGVHKCIGMHFGRSEVKAIIHRLLLTYRLELPADYQVKWDITALVFPADGLPITLSPLDPEPAPDQEETS